ncbi:hypothetical protein HXX76_001327 [Chlamydomonas incerta]|uniref:Uncharacterized protein n=1 Tax=Chlamydomonas incerta TaxID=51695 RepID=A0A835WC20_CHLIN|nr:hypothetical protein HXX76_001327 [Chlamydomonas incerta]|eukprot:KAG2444582.1 hypothetical protein HXX76_001327 [Chlamydomonas incerta]
MMIIKDEEKNRIRRWEDEKPSLERLIASLNQTCEILNKGGVPGGLRPPWNASLGGAQPKKDRKRLAAQLAAKQAAAAASGSGSQHGTPSKRGPGADGGGGGYGGSGGAGRDPAALQRQLDELSSRVAVTDIEIRLAAAELRAASGLTSATTFPPSAWCCRCDTRRILAEEMASLRADLSRLESSSRVEAERRRAEVRGPRGGARPHRPAGCAASSLRQRQHTALRLPESGWVEVARLEEALERTTARLDRAKQQLYFPAAKGYRFSSGNGGIYLAARDMHVSEVSGRFEFTCEPVAPRRGGSSSSAAGAGAGGRRPAAAPPGQGPAGGAGSGARSGDPSTVVARLTVALGGVSSSTALADRGSESRRALLGSQSSQTEPNGGGGGSGRGGGGGGSVHGGGSAHGGSSGGAGGPSLSTASAPVWGQGPAGAQRGGPGAVAEADTTRGGGGGVDPAALSASAAAAARRTSSSAGSGGGAGGSAASTASRQSGAASAVGSGAASPPHDVATGGGHFGSAGGAGGAGAALPPRPGGAAGHVLGGYGGGVAAAPPPPARSKAEGVANFLSSLKSKKDKLKNIVSGIGGDKERERQQAAAYYQQQQQQQQQQFDVLSSYDTFGSGGGGGDAHAFAPAAPPGSLRMGVGVAAHGLASGAPGRSSNSPSGTAGRLRGAADPSNSPTLFMNTDAGVKLNA